MLYGTNIVRLSVEQILVRMGVVRVGIEIKTKSLSDYVIGALMNNLSCLHSIITYIILVPGVIFTVVYGIKNGFKVFCTKNTLVYWLAILAVYTWFVVCANHSWQHYFFTYRLQLVSIIAFLLISYGSIIRDIKIKSSKEDKG